MTQVVVSDELRDRLTVPGADESVEVVDSSGKFVGMFRLARLGGPEYGEPTAEELARGLADPRRYTTEEVLAELRRRSGQ